MQTVDIVTHLVDDLAQQNPNITRTPAESTPTAKNWWFNVSHNGVEAYRLVCSKAEPFVRVWVKDINKNKLKDSAPYWLKYPDRITGYHLAEPDSLEKLTARLKNPPAKMQWPVNVDYHKNPEEL